MTREEIYKHFGPLLIEAIVITTMNEINILRGQLGLPERTHQQLIDALENRLSQLSEYDWMDEQRRIANVR